jgi:hypothetical protein
MYRAMVSAVPFDPRAYERPTEEQERVLDKFADGGIEDLRVEVHVFGGGGRGH